VPFAVVFARRGGAGARRVAAALAVVYVVGSLAYLALPSLGPAFAFRERFAAVYGGTTTFALQEMMLRSARHLLAHPETRALPFFGVAAFPSLHLATTGVGLFAAARWARPLLVLLVPWNLAIAWSALVFGWHYAVDFYPGLLLAGVAWWLAGRWTEPPVSGEAAAATPEAAATGA
jgi:membrane-associated phospholipid phosphatase